MCLTARNARPSCAHMGDYSDKYSACVLDPPVLNRNPQQLFRYLTTPISYPITTCVIILRLSTRFILFFTTLRAIGFQFRGLDDVYAIDLAGIRNDDIAIPSKYVYARKPLRALLTPTSIPYGRAYSVVSASSSRSSPPNPRIYKRTSPRIRLQRFRFKKKLADIQRIREVARFAPHCPPRKENRSIYTISWICVAPNRSVKRQSRCINPASRALISLFMQLVSGSVDFYRFSQYKASVYL